jgi:tRNA threonylcarbamoyl adenosine modification protein YeaZ
MITGILDTSGRAGFALHDGQRFAFSGTREIGGRKGDEILVPWLLGILRRLDLSPAAVDRWIVGTGPGSFTGTRVGIAFVRGIGAVSGAPVTGIPGSLALARSLAGDDEVPEHTRVAVLHDARRGQVIVSEYERSGECFRACGDARVADPTELPQACTACTAFVTPHGDPVADLVPASVRLLLHVRDGVDPSLLFDPPGYDFPADPAAAAASQEPVYVRPAVFVKPTQPIRPPSSGGIADGARP